MEQETKVTLRNYAICFGIEALLVFLVIWIKGFFTDSVAVNIQILSDAFFVAGLLMVLFAGLQFVSGEGALIGVQFVLRNMFLALIPMGRTKFEKYADYRARKLEGKEKQNNGYIIITGLVFLSIGIILTGIWYARYYNA